MASDVHEELRMYMFSADGVPSQSYSDSRTGGEKLDQFLRKKIHVFKFLKN